jgi:RNA polymerase sigma factor (sigma-70 family)
VSYLESADDRDLADRSRSEEREVLQQAADAVLSPRQQRILQLTCEGCSIGEIADELAISTDRVSDEKYKAIRKLREHFAAHPELTD